jgi:hypothetical protein
MITRGRRSRINNIFAQQVVVRFLWKRLHQLGFGAPRCPESWALSPKILNSEPGTGFALSGELLQRPGIALDPSFAKPQNPKNPKT